MFLRAWASDSLDEAVRQCVADLQGLVGRFDREADGFLATLESPFPRAAARNAINAWRSFNVGSLEWRYVDYVSEGAPTRGRTGADESHAAGSLRVGRYGLAPHTRPDGSVELVLGGRDEEDLGMLSVPSSPSEHLYLPRAA